MRGRVACARDPFGAGDWVFWKPGQVVKCGRHMRDAPGDVFFCSEHTAIMQRGIEGAFESGERGIRMRLWFFKDQRAVLGAQSDPAKLTGLNYLQGPSPHDQHFTAQPLQSQGGTLRYTRKADGKSYVMRRRAKEYPYYELRPDFMFLSMREGDMPFIA